MISRLVITCGNKNLDALMDKRGMNENVNQIFLFVIHSVLLFLISCSGIDILREAEDADEYCQRGIAHFEKGQYDQAISNYSKALVINHRLADVYGNRGLVYEKKGLYDLAIADYNKALEVDPDHCVAYNNRGNIYREKGLYDLAIADYDKALMIDPNLAICYFNRGNVYNDQGLYDLAIADYNKALEMDPQDFTVYFNKAIVCEITNQTRKAIEAYKAYIYYAPPEEKNRIEKAKERIEELEKSPDKGERFHQL